MNATIYTTDFATLTEGLQPCTVCDEAIQTARRIAADRQEDVLLSDADGLWRVHPDGDCDEVHMDTDEEEGAQILSATQLGDDYFYWADETGSWWMVAASDVGSLGRMGRDRYSEWCAATDALELPGLERWASHAELEAALLRAQAPDVLEDAS